ncbi:hypothetical protein H2203_007923 [Taxawa tesnikishii (nom. ined.)]|nr:hypothetical protein H2203_007923 [Dothideales sp. JES 119]
MQINPAWMLPLSLRAQATPYAHLSFVLATGYAALITLFSILNAINKRIAYGVPRELNWDDEVVVITGGSSGLGRVIANTYGMRGVTVAVLDVKPFYEMGKEEEDESGQNIKWYECDIGDGDAVRKVKEAIEKDLGTPTILINNAGVVNGAPLLSLSTSQIERNFRINLLSHYHTIRIFLPSMLAREDGGTIVTVSSVLGHLGASHLSDYTAAKAGLIAMHASLRAELNAIRVGSDAPAGAKNIRTVLVKPGQLSTPLFQGCGRRATSSARWWSRWIWQGKL